MSLEKEKKKKIFKVLYHTWDTVFDHWSEKRVENTTCSGVFLEIQVHFRFWIMLYKWVKEMGWDVTR